MSQRRMFSPDIVKSEEFLSMPISSQALYFHLGMSADDDGFVQPKPTMRLIGASDDDLKVLLVKRFLLPFESGVVVIKHWLIHNMIRADRYKPTRFIDEKNSLFIKENKAYTDKNPLGCQNDNQMATQYRLGKDRLGKDSIDNNNLPPSAEKNMRMIESEDPTDLKILNLDEEGQIIDPVKQKVKQAKGYDPAWTNELLKWAMREKREGRNFTRPLKQKAHISAMLAAGWTPDEIKAKWDLLEGEYWGGRGIDFTIVANEMDKTEPIPQIVKI